MGGRETPVVSRSPLALSWLESRASRVTPPAPESDDDVLAPLRRWGRP